MWGKAILVAINADAANSDGNVGTGSDNAQSACQGAQSVSDSLATKLTTPSNLFSFSPTSLSVIRYACLEIKP